MTEIKTYAISDRLSIEDVARLYRISDKTVRRHLHKIRTVRIGKEWRIDAADLLAKDLAGKLW